MALVEAVTMALMMPQRWVLIVAASLEGGLPVLAGFQEDVPIGARLK